MTAWGKRRRDFEIPQGGIDKVETLSIGGVNQSILIQGYSRDNPVLLFLHGGPSMPIPGVSGRGVDYALVTCTQELVKHCTVVFWDQRGTGRSYSRTISAESMHVEKYVEDALEVTDYLRSVLGKEKIHLVGHSWGTLLGMQLIIRYPERYATYSAFSQMVSWMENDKLCYKWLMEKADTENNLRMRKALSTLGEPPYHGGLKQWGELRKWLMRNKSMFHSTNDGLSPTMGSLLRMILSSPDYKLKDVYHSMVSGFKLAYNERFLSEIQQIDYRTDGCSLSVPVQFIHGRHDRHVMPSLVEQYYRDLDAPLGKRLLWSEQSSHVFHLLDAKANERSLIEWMLLYEEKLL